MAEGAEPETQPLWRINEPSKLPLMGQGGAEGPSHDTVHTHIRAVWGLRVATSHVTLVLSDQVT